jgi:hypothetical protein
MVHVSSSRRSCGDKAEDGHVDAMGCNELFYPNFVIFIVLGHMGSLVISFPITRTPWVGGADQGFRHPSPTPSQGCFLRGIVVHLGVREERRESERSPQSSKEWGMLWWFPHLVNS